LNNREVADLFERIADMLEIKGEIIHRVLAYRNAAQAIREFPRDLRVTAAENALETIPGVGKIIAEKITEILDTGTLEFHERLAAEVPTGVVDILHVNGVGPKKARMFWQEAGLTTLAQLEQAAREGKLRSLPGMGAKSEQRILEGIESLRRRASDTRIPLGIALPTAERILKALRSGTQVDQFAVAGSIRRGRPTIGDVDLLITSAEPKPIMDAFVHMEEVARILGHGDSKSSVELLNGLQVDLRVVPAERWGTALCYFTGSQAHNIRIRHLALDRGLSLNEFAFTPTGGGNEILCSTEEAVYAQVGLPFIPPELREDRGEIEAAQKGTLPDLIEAGQIQSNLHMHTTWSDGTASIREMAEAARERGLRYIVITDHSRGAVIANGLSIERLQEQANEIRRVDAELNGSIRVFHGTEMEIKADGTPDFPDEVLETLDFVVASLHVSLRQPREQVTRRLIHALQNRHVDLIGHPTGQLIPDRDGADLDLEAVFTAAAASGTAMEINASPERLDLTAQNARRAQELGIPISINTDAHSIADLDNLRYGILTARRGWIESHSVINTWPVDRFVTWTRQRHE